MYVLPTVALILCMLLIMNLYTTTRTTNPTRKWVPITKAKDTINFLISLTNTIVSLEGGEGERVRNYRRIYLTRAIPCLCYMQMESHYPEMECTSSCSPSHEPADQCPQPQHQTAVSLSPLAIAQSQCIQSGAMTAVYQNMTYQAMIQDRDVLRGLHGVPLSPPVV